MDSSDKLENESKTGVEEARKSNNNDEKKQDENPFRRSGKMERSPVSKRRNSLPEMWKKISNKKPEAACSKTQQEKNGEEQIQGATGQEIDPSMDEAGRCREVVVASGAAELGRICRQLTEADEKEERQLDLISKELSAMQTASYKQKNVSMDIKRGMLRIEEYLDVIRACRLIRLNAIEGLQVKASLTVSPKLKDQQALPPRKRPRPTLESPEAPPKQINLDDPMEGSIETTPWTEVVRNTKKKNKKKNTKTLKETEKNTMNKDVHLGRATGRPKTQPSQKKFRSKPVKPRKDAVLIKPSAGKSFAEILGAIKKNVKPEASGAEVRQI